MYCIYTGTPWGTGGKSAPRVSTLIPSINWPHEWRRVSSKSHEWGQLIRGIWVDKRGADIPSVPIKGSRYRHYYFCSIWGPSIRDIHSNYRFVSHIVWNKEYEVPKLSTLSPASYDIICGWSPPRNIYGAIFSLWLYDGAVAQLIAASLPAPAAGVQLLPEALFKIL